MSAYVTLMTPMSDEECLLEALAEVGFRRAQVEVHKAPVALVGFEGLSRATQAHLVIRRQHVGPSSNDLGFLRTPMGYQVLVSDYDQGRYGPPWRQRLAQAYERSAKAKKERQEAAQRLAQERLAAAQRAAAEEEARRAAEEVRRAEEEAQRAAAARRQLVEAQRQAIQEKARKLGYRVTETRVGDKLQLVLAKRVYG